MSNSQFKLLHQSVNSVAESDDSVSVEATSILSDATRSDSLLHQIRPKKASTSFHAESVDTQVD